MATVDIEVEEGFLIDEFDITDEEKAKLFTIIKLLGEENLTVEELTFYFSTIKAQEMIKFIDAGALPQFLKLFVLENYKLGSNADLKKFLSLVVSDDYGFSDSAVSNADFLFQVNEKYNINSFINLLRLNQDGELEVEESLDCWVVNADTQAFSKYNNYNFNSFALFNKKYYAANNIGLFQLDNNTLDDNKRVEMKVKTGMLNVGNGAKSFLRDVYIYHKSDGEIKLKVITEDSLVETYKLLNPSDNLISSKIGLSKGRKAINWQFELTTDDDFNLDEIKLYRLITGRLS